MYIYTLTSFIPLLYCDVEFIFYYIHDLTDVEVISSFYQQTIWEYNRVHGASLHSNMQRIRGIALKVVANRPRVNVRVRYGERNKIGWSLFSRGQ